MPRNSNVTLYHDVKFPKDYTVTMFWDSFPQKESFFRTKIFENFDNLSYIRVTENRIRLDYLGEMMFLCDYLKIENGDHERIPFYCFVDAIEYVNDSTVDVTYTVDVMQTFCSINQSAAQTGSIYKTDIFRLKSCMIEREIPNRDQAGDNLQADFVIGDYTTVRELVKPEDKTENGVILTAGKNVKLILDSIVSTKSPLPSILTGNLNGLAMLVFKSVEELQNFIVKIAHFESALISSDWISSIENIVIFPNEFLPEVEITDKPFTPQEGADYSLATYNFPKNTGRVGNSVTRLFLKTNFLPEYYQQGELDGYKPINNKLYTFPYNYLRLYTPDGLSKDYQIEYFQGAIQWDKCAILGISPSITYVPNNYLGKQKNFEEGLNQTAFPQGSLSSDAFVAWWAQNAPGVLKDVGIGVAGVVSGAALGNPLLIAGGAASLLNSAVNTDNQRRKPNSIQGTTLPNINAGFGNLEASCEQVSLKRQYLKQIDEYFSRYGYATNQFRQVKRANREYFTYVQTSGDMPGSGSIPSVYSQKIKEIFENGVTFWRGSHWNEFGNFSREIFEKNKPIANAMI